MNESDKTSHAKTYLDFLQMEDHSFLMWRLTHDVELEAFWNNYIASHPEDRQAFDRAIAVADSIKLNDRKISAKELLFSRINTSMEGTKRHRARTVTLWRWVAAAAVIVLIFTLQPLFKGLFNSGEHRFSASELAQITNCKDVQLIIGNQRFVLSDSADVKIKGRQVFCGQRNMGEWSDEDGEHSKLIVPAGKHSFLTLADNSKVWINSASEVDFPLVYADASRDIHVKGEIFIDVTKNPERPFTVHTQQMDVLVHGTQFNVSAYSQEKETSVVLVRGKVQAIGCNKQSMMMQPNQRVVFSEGNIKRENVDVSKYVSWKNGYLACNEEYASDVLRKVSLYYNIKCAPYNTNLLRRKITGKLYLSSDVNDILTSIALMTKTTYTRHNNQVEFHSK